MMVLDGTWLVHLPKVVWWLVCEGNLAFFLYRFYQPQISGGNGCYSPGWTQTSSALIVVSLWRRDPTQLMQAPTHGIHACPRYPHPMRHRFLLQVGMIVWVLWITYHLSRATRSLQQRPYTAFRCREHAVCSCVFRILRSSSSAAVLLSLCRVATLIVRLQVRCTTCWAVHDVVLPG